MQVTPERRVRNQIRRGRSEGGIGTRSPVCVVSRLREQCRGSKKASNGVCATMMVTAGMTVRPSPSVGLECVDTTLHDSVQESQSRGSEDSVPSGVSFGTSQGQSLGHLSGVSRDVSCPGTPSAQHSTRIPARQSVGIPTKLHVMAMSAIIRMVPVYTTPPRGSTNGRMFAVSVA